MSEPTKEATAYALDEAKQAQKRHGLTDLATAMYMEAAELGYMQGIAAAQPEPAAREMPEAVRDAVDTLRSGVPSYPTWRQYADTLESWWRNLAQPVAVGMTEELEHVLSIAERDLRYKEECFDDSARTVHDERIERLRAAIAAVRQQAAQGRKVELGKVRELIEWEVKNNGSGLWAAALAELDAAEGKERE